MPLHIESCPFSGKCKSVSEFFSGYPLFKKSAEAFCKKPLREFGSDSVLYVVQREYATVTPGDENVTIIGSEDATTCHIIVLHHTGSGAVSLGHFDGNSTEQGINSMMESLLQTSQDLTSDGRIELHMFGGFLDDQNTSASLTLAILDCFQKLSHDVHLMTACVTDLNNIHLNGQNRPILYGIGYDVQKGDIFPASFVDKGPDEALRHARIFGGHRQMLQVYSSSYRELRIGPFSYHVSWVSDIQHFHFFLRCPDEVILRYLSTSPHCEPASFAATTRAALRHLLDHPEPLKSEFPDGKPHTYKRGDGGRWVRV